MLLAALAVALTFALAFVTPAPAAPAALDLERWGTTIAAGESTAAEAYDPYGPETDELGSVLAALGDVDGDHRADLAVGYRGLGNEAKYDGRLAAEVLRGPLLLRPGLGTLFDPGEFGPPPIVHGRGDVDGDGRDDIAVVVDGVAHVAAATVADAVSAAIVGDVDGDGRDDIAVAGAHSTIVSGRGSGETALTAPEGESGYDARAAGDVDGDGRADVAVLWGTPSVRHLTIVFGSAFGSTVALDDPGASGARLVAADGDRAGADVAALGDVDGDGLGDIAVGAPGAGEVFVVRGARERGDVDLETVGPRVIRLAGSPAGRTGAALAADDFDGDGRRDLAIGTPLAGGGEVDVVLGPLTHDVQLAAGPWRGWRLIEHGRDAGAGAGAGAALAAPGDVDGDGRADLAVGVPSAIGGACHDPASDGRVMLVRGARDRPRVARNTATPGADDLRQIGQIAVDGLGGDDVLRGSCLRGGDGDDRLIGVPGNDDLRGGRGRDRISGGLGADLIDGGRGDDHVDGGPEGDRLNGGPGRDVILGGGGDDLILAGSGRDVVRGGPGDDRIQAHDGVRDIIDCGPGEDEVSRDRFDRVRHCEVRGQFLIRALVLGPDGELPPGP